MSQQFLRGAILGQAMLRVCVKCGRNTGPNKLHFHHVDPESKLDDVRAMARQTSKYTMEDFCREILKCVPVCAYCHKGLPQRYPSCEEAQRCVIDWDLAEQLARHLGDMLEEVRTCRRLLS